MASRETGFGGIAGSNGLRMASSVSCKVAWVWEEYESRVTEMQMEARVANDVRREPRSADIACIEKIGAGGRGSVARACANSQRGGRQAAGGGR